MSIAPIITFKAGLCDLDVSAPELLNLFNLDSTPLGT